MIESLFSVTIGPLPQCRDRVWKALTDFQNWAHWLPDLQQLSRPDAEIPGRGSLLEFHWNGHHERATISYWHPGRRLELIQHQSGDTIGYRFNLDTASDSEHIRLAMEVEIECEGTSLLHPLRKRIITRRIKSRYQVLFANLQSLGEDENQ